MHSRLALGFAFVCCFMIGGTVNAQPWVEYFDSPGNLASPTLENTFNETDFAVIDVDLDGDLDVVAVMKSPFTTFGPRENVLLINIDGVLTERTATYAPDLMSDDNARDVQGMRINDDDWPDLVIANATAPTTVINAVEGSGTDVDSPMLSKKIVSVSIVCPERRNVNPINWALPKTAEYVTVGPPCVCTQLDGSVKPKV